MKNLFCFDTMLTPKIITVLYWLLLFALFVAGFATMFSGMGGAFFLGLMVIVLGALVVRIWSELFIVLFKIHDHLKTIAERGGIDQASKAGQESEQGAEKEAV